MKLFKHKEGQGLLEAITAIAFISMSVLAVVALVISNVQASKASTSRSIASGLLWEGIEVIRNIRNSNWLAGVAWDQSIDSPGGDNTGIIVFDDATNTWVMDYSANSILTDPSTQIFQKGRLYLQGAAPPAGGEAIDYFRLVSTIPIDANSMRIVSEVRWVERGETKSLVGEEIIYDWK